MGDLNAGSKLPSFRVLSAFVVSLGHVGLVRIGIRIQISDPSDPSDSTEHFILDLDCCHVDNGAHKSPKRMNVVLIASVVKKSTGSISIHVCVSQCVQKWFLPAIYAQRSHLDPMDPGNPAPRGGLIGPKSEGSGSRFDKRKGANPVDPVDRDPDPTKRTCPKTPWSARHKINYR